MSEQIQIIENDEIELPIMHNPNFAKRQENWLLIEKLEEQEKAINESYQELEIEKESEDEDSYAVESLVQDAYVLCNEIENEWKNIVIAIETGDDDHNRDLKKRKKSYFKNVLGDRAWEVKDLIDKFVEDNIHDKSLFGKKDNNYESLYKQIDAIEEEKRSKIEARKLMSMRTYLGKTVTKKIKIEEVEVITSNIPTSVNIPDVR